MSYEPQHLKRWAHPECYFGATWEEYFSFLGRSRDSDALERANFEAGLEALGGESETVCVAHEGHWAVGWVEGIRIHESDEKALREADEIAGRLADYPVVDEERWSAIEDEECQLSWDQSSVRERAKLLARFGHSIFAARRDWDHLGIDDYNGGIKDRLLGH